MTTLLQDDDHDDLVALDTMNDDDPEEDKWQLASLSGQSNPLASYMNSVAFNSNNTYHCPICTKPFGAIEELESHTRLVVYFFGGDHFMGIGRNRLLVAV